MQWEQELSFARSVMMQAGELALTYATQNLKPDSKADLSPVTLADRECEKLIVSRIAQEFPDDGILGEEGTDKAGISGRRWIVDPIDGTRDFVRGLPLWANLIGLEVGAEVVLGVANFPPQKSTYWAARGQGAYCNGERIAISRITDPTQSLACLNGINSYTMFPFASRFLEWADQFWAVRSMGGAYDAMLLASGHAEVWLEPKPQPWDLAALQPILEEAGAVMRNFNGGNSIYGGGTIAYVPALESTIDNLLYSAGLLQAAKTPAYSNVPP